MALIDDAGQRDTIAEAQEETLLCLIAKADFEALLQRHPQVNLRVTKFIGWRLRTVENQDLSKFRAFLDTAPACAGVTASRHDDLVAEGTKPR